MARRGGWRRRGRKRFRYVDARGREIRDEESLERLRALAIPPAWRDVWISPSPGAKLQATGVDAAGRKQYLYHPSYRAAQERGKFERLLDFAEALPTLRSRAERHLRLDPYEQAWTCAVAVGLVNKAWFRVGSDRHARRSRTYGVTTLRKRHVAVAGDEIMFRFHAKNCTLVRRTLRSAPLARGVEELLALPNGPGSSGTSARGNSPISPRRRSTHTSPSTSGTGSRPRTSGPGAGPSSRPWSWSGARRRRAPPSRSRHWPA